MSNPTEKTDKPNDEKKPDAKEWFKDEPPVATSHELTFGDKTLRYTAHAGKLPIKNEKGEVEAGIFFMSYTLDTQLPSEKRPLLIAFNGGPGSSSVWLHLGAIGPKRAVLNPDGTLPPPPYKLVPNEFSWLEHADLVFIDPVGTGYSRAKDEETAKKFYGVEGDIKCLAEFIRLYLTRFERWASPLYLAGESYGTTRGAGLAGHLINEGIAFSGILLISTVLNFQTLIFGPGNDLPYSLFLPTFTATAWYHKRLSEDLQSRPLPEVLQEVEAFADGEYTLALMRGDRLSDAERESLTVKLARFTGLSEQYVRLSLQRVSIFAFCKELLRDQGLIVGRFDSRITGRGGRGTSETMDYDPSGAVIRPPYTAAFNNYIRRELEYKDDVPYIILGGLYGLWDWGRGNNFVDTAAALRSAIEKNPHLQVFVASGYYDMATPYFATEYTLAHLGIDPELRKNIEVAYYEAGHMMYIESGSQAKLKVDVDAFLTRTMSHL
jgi:carboxypeptidase C (cathepsin A)